MKRILVAALAVLFPVAVQATPLTAGQEHAIDISIGEWLAQTGVAITGRRTSSRRR